MAPVIFATNFLANGGKLNSQPIDGILERIQDLSGVDHIVAMHVLLKILLEKYCQKMKLGNGFYQYSEVRKFDVDEILREKKLMNII